MSASSIIPKRFNVATLADGSAQVTNLATGEVLDWVDAVQLMGWKGEGQVLWLGVIISDFTVATAVTPAGSSASPASIVSPPISMA